MDVVFILMVAIPVIAAGYLSILWELEERDLRRDYAMFGTTGFYDVDDRLRTAERPGHSYVRRRVTGLQQGETVIERLARLGRTSTA